MQLDPNQIIARNFLASQRYAILADEPGVGKTAPAIEAVKSIFPYFGDCLIVCPAYLMRNWFVELVNWGTEEKDIQLIQGRSDDKQRQIKANNNWTIISYDTFARKIYLDLLKENRYSFVIYDEAHYLRNRKTVRYRAAKELRPTVGSNYFLTGTPLVSDGGDLYTLLNLCDPKTYKSYWKFVNDNCYTTQNPWKTEIGALRDENKFYKTLSPYLLRRKLENVPETIEKTIYVDLSKSTYDELKNIKTEYRAKNRDNQTVMLTSAGALIHALRRTIITDSKKLDVCRDILNESPDKQFVIYTWYRETAKQVEKLLSEDRVSYQTITGETPVNKRLGIVESHKQQKFRVIVATLSALQEGANLQYCSNVIFLEEDWLEKTHIQAMGRFVRRGQTQPVNVWNIVAYKTIDELVHKVRMERRDWNLKEILPEVIA